MIREPALRPPVPMTDAVTVLIGAAMIGSLFSDGWAHLNLPSLETFFTPWHGALYASLAAAAAWIGWSGRDGLRAGRWGTAFPLGYRLGAIGVVVFAIGGLGDLAWHVVFGVEVGIDALLSPTHLTLLSGALLILSSPLRARWALAPGTDALTLLALALVTAAAAFFLLYTSAFARAAPAEAFVPLPEAAPGHEASELPAVVGLSSYLVTTGLFVVPLLLVVRRGRAPRGVVTALVAPIAVLSVAVVDFPAAAVGGAAGATLGALATDLLIGALRRRTGRAPVRPAAVAATAAALVWSGQLAGIAAADAVRWPPALWSGVVVLATMAAGAIGLLAEGRPAGERPPAIAPG